jgi:hypothetical protein
VKARMVFEIRAAIDFLDMFQQSPLLSRSSETWASAMARVRELKYVEDAWINHMCVIEVHTETSNVKVAERRITDVITKATRIINSYKPEVRVRIPLGSRRKEQSSDGIEARYHQPQPARQHA